MQSTTRTKHGLLSVSNFRVKINLAIIATQSTTLWPGRHNRTLIASTFSSEGADAHLCTSGAGGAF